MNDVSADTMLANEFSSSLTSLPFHGNAPFGNLLLEYSELRQNRSRGRGNVEPVSKLQLFRHVPEKGADAILLIKNAVFEISPVLKLKLYFKNDLRCCFVECGSRR